MVQNSVFVFDCNRVTCACVCESECLLLVLFDVSGFLLRVCGAPSRGVFFLPTAVLPCLLFYFAYIARAVCFESDFAQQSTWCAVVEGGADSFFDLFSFVMYFVCACFSICTV